MLDKKVAVVAAHPDDETLGLGGQLHLPLDATFIYTTDGAPRNLEDARAHGFTHWREYSQARKKELETALGLTALPEIRIHDVGIADQEAAFHITDLAEALCARFEEVRPDLIVTHPFEGGHPDHDATAVAVHIATQTTCPHVHLMEFTSYHSSGGRLVAGEFLGDEPEVISIHLSAEAFALKTRMIACFTTQAEFIRPLVCRRECFRPVPRYDFTRRPHAGPLFYETWNSGMNWDKWLDCIGAVRDDSARRLSVRAR